MSPREIVLGTSILILSGVILGATHLNPIRSEELPGVYELVDIDASSTISRQIIEIHDDGSYNNTFIKGGHVMWSYKDRWKFQLQYKAIDLKNFRFEIDIHTLLRGLERGAQAIRPRHSNVFL
jgi:hypothetical protein